jgi:membrane fusion protein (multidrug efflux system)
MSRVLLVALLLLPPGWLAAQPPATLVEVVQPQRGLVRDELLTFGSLLADESVLLRSEIDGRIAALYFQEGERVAAGALLVSLDDAVSRAELAQARADLELAERSLQRTRQLFQRGASNPQALDQARAQQRAALASVQLAEARLDKTRLRAPHAGTLGLRQVSVGDYVEAGQDLVNLEVLDPLKVEFRIPQKAVSQVRRGQAVELGVDAWPDERFPGRIYALNPRLDEVGRSQTVRAQVANADGRLHPGQFVRLWVILAERPQAVLLPEEAVMPLGAQQYVNLVVDGRVERRAVQLGRRRDGLVEVREGLDGTESVISAGWHKVAPGMAVRTREAGKGA